MHLYARLIIYVLPEYDDGDPFVTRISNFTLRDVNFCKGT